MQARWGSLLVAGTYLLFLACGVLFAHHGTNASYDLGKTITLNGIVTEFAFSYPHVQLYFDVKDQSGKIEHWAAELPGTPIMLRNFKVGWSKTAIKPDDQVTLTCYPSKAPSAKVCLGDKLLVNGKELPTGRNAGGREDGEGKQ